MQTRHKHTAIALSGLILFLASLACQSMFPTVIKPGSLEAQIAEGNVRFGGRGNVTYIGCQDPSAVVSLYVAPKTKEVNGEKLSDFVNLVTIETITDGTMVRMGECQKSSQGEKYNWPAKGIYYPKDGKILFTTCTQNDNKAEGEGYLEGEGFEGEYACYDSDGDLMYEVAFSAYEMGK